MADSSDILWNLYQEHCTWERHHEAQRSSVTTLMVAIAACILTVVTFDGRLNYADLPLTLFLMMQGIFGAVFAAKHYERFCMNQTRANMYRTALDSKFPEAGILSIREAADKSNQLKFRRLSKLRLHGFWIGLHLTISLFGTILTVAVLLKWFN